MTSAQGTPAAGRFEAWSWPALGTWLAIPLAAGVGVLTTLGPAGLIVVAAGLAVAATVLLGRRIVGLFPPLLALLLLGYVFLDRGFAHVGIGPLYLGEGVLAVGLVAMAIVLPRARVGGVEALLLAFMAWGAARTIPYIGIYGVDALRDAVTWGYAMFALALAWTLREEHVRLLVRTYRRIVWPLVLWLPLALVVATLFGDRLPDVPGSTTSILSVKAGDVAVNLAGVAAFVLTGLYSAGSVQQGAMEVLLWVAWLVPASAAAALNRGAMAAAATAGVAALFVRSSSRWIRVAMVGLLIFVSASLLNPQVDIGSNRQLSFQQLVSNAVSLFGGEGGALNDATKAWREAWWAKIIGYTVDGPDFWTGKGYGINLADADGFQVTSDDSLRAPHSVHFEILARSGVPGLVLWLAVLAAWIVMMLRAAIRAARSRRRFLLALIGWVVAYWLASLVNGSVDVYIGGPQGGILFWSLFGLGLVLARLARDPHALGDAEMPAPAPRPTRPMVASPG